MNLEVLKRLPWRTILGVALTIGLTISGYSMAGTRARVKGEKAIARLAADCDSIQAAKQAKIDSLTTELAGYQAREARRDSTIKARESVFSAHRRSQSGMQRSTSRAEIVEAKHSSGIIHYVIPILSFAAGVIVGHNWESAAVTQTVTIVEQACGHGKPHAKKWRPKQCRK